MLSRPSETKATSRRRVDDRGKNPSCVLAYRTRPRYMYNHRNTFGPREQASSIHSSNDGLVCCNGQRIGKSYPWVSSAAVFAPVALAARGRVSPTPPRRRAPSNLGSDSLLPTPLPCPRSTPEPLGPAMTRGPRRPKLPWPTPRQSGEPAEATAEPAPHVPWRSQGPTALGPPRRRRAQCVLHLRTADKRPVWVQDRRPPARAPACGAPPPPELHRRSLGRKLSM